MIPVLDSQSHLALIPHKPGCYMYFDTAKRIIYIGKAKDLRKRVSNYFLKDRADHDVKTAALVSNIAAMDYVITDNEVEALLLESRLIKQYKPKYNIDLKENERYAYIKITDEPHPRLITARRKDSTEKGQYFGPFVDGYSRALTVKILNDSFQLRTCKKMPDKVCLNYHLGLCTGPCEGKVTKEQYLEQVNRAKKFLKGGSAAGELRESLAHEMKEYARKQQFEVARLRRDQLRALDVLDNRQKVDTLKEFDQDVIGYSTNGKTVSYFIFNIVRGTINKKDEFTVTIPDRSDEMTSGRSANGDDGDSHDSRDAASRSPSHSDASAAGELDSPGGSSGSLGAPVKLTANRTALQRTNEEFLMQYYADRAPPKEIVVSENFVSDPEYPIICDALTTIVKKGGAGYQVVLTIPRLGDKKRLLDLATTNADYSLAGESPVLIALKERLKLPTIPYDIECYDISNLGDDYIVAAKVHFTNAQPNKAQYRRFRIKWTAGQQNDFAAMYEVIKRRFYKIKMSEAQDRVQTGAAAIAASAANPGADFVDAGSLRETPGYGATNRIDVSGEKMPDLVIIDGGKGQLGAAIEALRSLEMKVPIISLAKREEEIYFPGLSKPLKTNNNAARAADIRLLQRIRDETHRFVITYHRHLRDTKSINDLDKLQKDPDLRPDFS